MYGFGGKKAKNTPYIAYPRPNDKIYRCGFADEALFCFDHRTRLFGWQALCATTAQ